MKRFVTLFLLAAFSVVAQKSLPVTSYQASNIFFQTLSPVFNISNVAEADLPDLLKATAGYPEDITLSLSLKINSKALTHYRYQLYKDGIRIYGAEIHVGLDHNNKIRVCSMPALPQFYSGSNFPEAGTAETIRTDFGADSIMRQSAVWYTNQSDYLQKGMIVELYGPETLHREILVDNQGIISDADLHRYFHGPNDSLVSVKVFTPDPLSTARVTYGGQYVDNNDQPSPALDNERQVKPLVLAFESGEFKAKNDFVKILDFSAPSIAPATSTSNQLYYTRDQDAFEDINVMYHISNHKQHLIDLGFPGIPNYIIEVDAHAINGSDQSFFSTATVPGRLYFGEGGVDDAEDADVIIHEFMHSAIFVAAPSSVTTTERGCIEEALGDYFAASYSNSIGTYNEQYVFNWDGNNEFWAGREVESLKDYGKQSFKNGNIYGHTDLFASPLMEMNRKLGRNTADQLILEAIFNLNNNTTMPIMAGYIILSDSLLNGGVNYQVIYDAFVRRNILPTISIAELESFKSDIQVFNTMAFANGGPVMIRPGTHTLSSFTLTDLNGRTMLNGTLDSIDEEVVEISAPELPSGVYLLTLTSSKGYQLTHKLTRIN